MKKMILLVLGGIAIIACNTPRQTTREALPSRNTLSEEQQRKYDYFFLEAYRLKTELDNAGAFDMLRHSLEINPQAAGANFEIAQFYLAMNQLPKVQESLEKAVQYNPDNYWFTQGLASFYRQQGAVDKATALLEEMTHRFPNRVEPLYTLLEIYNRTEAYSKSIATLNTLEEKTGKNEQISMEKLRVYLQMKDNKSAFREIEGLMAEYPLDMRYPVILGDLYLQNGKTQEAYTLYNKVLTEDPDNAQALYSLASYYEVTGQKEQYRQQLDTLLLNKKVASDVKLDVMRRFMVENNNDSVRVMNLFDRIMAQEPDDSRLPMFYARYLVSKNMNDKAIPVLKQVLDLEPANSAARITLLGEAIRQQDTTAIIRLCEGGVETNPDMPEFYFYLAIGYNQADRTDDALAICKKAVNGVSPDTKKEVISDFYTIMADAYHIKGMNTEAYIAYDSALVYNPANVGALNNYAYYLSLERKDLDKAEEMSYKTVKTEPNNATYLDTYAWILFEKGKYAEARIYIDNAIMNNTDKSDVIVEHCGDIYYMTGDPEGALKYWKEALELGSKSKTLKQKIEKKKYIPE
ncbi:MAG: tetratricopeptide repeat protein [Prevotellaceae bacterium]|nr:tetratricopeptide repeat protein [Prevotellaceae bacterium]